MKLHILSDLHVEFDMFAPPQTESDAVILAGDIHVGKKGIDWAKEKFLGKHVIYLKCDKRTVDLSTGELLPTNKPTEGRLLHS